MLNYDTDNYISTENRLYYSSMENIIKVSKK